MQPPGLDSTLYQQKLDARLMILEAMKTFSKIHVGNLGYYITP